jgi:hypothetical protein
VHVSPDSLGAYRQLTPGAAMPDGSVLLMLHRRAGSGGPGPVHVMEKAQGEWTFNALGPDGSETATDEQRCRRCHQEAGTDLIFGPPRRPLATTEAPE